MKCRVLEITLQYAKDLKNVNLVSKMDVYVVVSISGGDKNSEQKSKTTVDHDGDANPTWNFPMKFVVEEAALLQNRLMLDFKLKCERVLGDKDIGEVHVPIKDLLDFLPRGRGGAAKKFVSYQVKKPSGKPKGQLTFSYQFREKTTTSGAPPPPPPLVEEECGESMTTYPVVEPSSLYPPPPLVEDVCEEPMAAYPVVEPVSPYRPMTPGGYPLPPSHPVTMAPARVGGLYPPPEAYLPVGELTPEWYPPQPACGDPPSLPNYVYPPPPLPLGYVYPPPVMQLAPNWWIVDWRYDFPCC